MFITVLLDCIRKINSERSISSIYHLLTGKRSAQTLQDAHLYQLENYFGIYKTITRDELASVIKQLERQKCIESNQNAETAQISVVGKGLLDDASIFLELTGFNGMKYENISSHLEQRLLLLIQTITNIEARNNRFVAIVEDVGTQQFVKEIYNTMKNRRREWLRGLFKEIHSFLRTIPQNQASIFVDRLTGYDQFGLSKEQLAQKYQVSKHDIAVTLQLIIHKLLTFLLNETKNSLYLSTLIKDYVEQTFITNSAAETLNLFQRGYNLEQIMSIRKLKESTIHDHLVEIAYADADFNIEPFVTKDSFVEIARVIDELDSRKLKVIKQHLNENYSYFQIRLVMAAMQSHHKRGSELS
ncbi:helix-turn-helix domain-containing protein [Aquibacillus sediminis]|uniref:helix-turn-helix domain-containing protein n=1 Tax=Aquibacillus sediminis TaxID=2574734 RepID=UPI001107F951|nr:helix-turn-helix domain-containing protein [Aquibacillus sediminis]